MLSARHRTPYLVAPLLFVTVYSAGILCSSSCDSGGLYTIWGFYLRATTLAWALLGVLWIIVSLLRESLNAERRALPHYLADVVSMLRRPSSIIVFTLPPIVFALLMTGYSVFKQAVLPATGYWADPYLAGFEHRLLLGHHAWEITHAILPPGASYWLDQIYHMWFILMVGSVLLCSYISSDPLHRCRFMLCFAAIWIIAGTVLAFLIPVSGPVYFGHFQGGVDPFLALKDKLARDDLVAQAAHGTGIMSLKGQAFLLKMSSAQAPFPSGGISGMPSIHNAIATLLACAAFSVKRWLGWVMTLFALLIFIGSVHLGWHYASDGIVAALASIFLWFSSHRVIARFERRRHDRRADRNTGRRASDRNPRASETQLTASA